MKKVLLFVFLLGCGLGSLQAQTSLVILKNDGTTQSQEVTNQTTIKFTDGQMTVYENNVELLTISTEEMHWFQFNSTVGIKFVDPAEKTAITLKQNGDQLLIKGLKKETAVSLYYINGKQCLNKEVAPDGNLNIGNLPAGVYFLKVENTVYKFMKK